MKAETINAKSIKAEIKKKNNKVGLFTSLSAALLAATTMVGPGFTTQTAKFSVEYLGAFFLVIFVVLILDLVAQGNIYRVICFTRKHVQEVADAVKPGLGYFLSGLVVIGIFVFQFSNIAGTGLGMQALTDMNTSLSTLLSGIIAILIFMSKSANKIINLCAQVLGGVLLVVAVIIAFISDPPVAQIPSQIATTNFAVLILPIVTILGGSCGGYAPFIGTHRLLDANISGKENYYLYKRTQFLAAGTAYIVRILLSLCTFGVVMAGAIIDMNNPAPSSFQAAAGMFGYRIYGVVMLAAGITTIVGAAVILCSMVKCYIPWVEPNERLICIIFIAFCTIIDVAIGQPVNLLVAASALNSLVLPIVLLIMLLASHNKKVMGEDYKHPWFLTVGGIIVMILSAYLGIANLPTVINLFR